MRERRFKIEAYTPATIPMLRLAEHLEDLAKLIGEPQYVHFSRLEEGSTVACLLEEDEAQPKIDERLDHARRGEGPSDAIDAIKRINRRLREDNGTGALTEMNGVEVMRFPGREATEVTFGAFNQQGTLDGIVIVVGGKGDPVPVHIQAKEDADRIYNCYANRTLAKELAGHIFGAELRISGIGRWLRDAGGNWNLERFTITGFDSLNDQPLSSVVASLRAIKGSEWESVKDPWAELALIRNGSNKDSE